MGLLVIDLTFLMDDVAIVVVVTIFLLELTELSCRSLTEGGIVWVLVSMRLSTLHFVQLLLKPQLPRLIGLGSCLILRLHVVEVGVRCLVKRTSSVLVIVHHVLTLKSWNKVSTHRHSLIHWWHAHMHTLRLLWILTSVWMLVGVHQVPSWIHLGGHLRLIRVELLTIRILLGRPS